MFENLTVFHTSSAMARHAGRRQALISQNIANADTPGYVGKKLAPFSMLYAPTDTITGQRATRADHLHGSNDSLQMISIDIRGGDNPNSNTVSLENELLKAAEAKGHHDRAIAIYKSALDVLRLASSTK